MASRKLTQLPTATEVTASDKIYIVDVSDTSESPQGTSKQAVISNLPSSGITTLTSTDGSIDIDLTDPSAPDLSIGYTSYVAQISQVGTNNPTITVIKNTTGRTLSLTRVEQGVYSGTLSGSIIDQNKLFYYFRPSLSGFIELTIDGGNTVTFGRTVIDFDILAIVNSDGFDTYFEIRIYQ
jgi:hypothetical protein